MNTYIALLRGINVVGHRKIKMGHLKEVLEKIGFNDVVTYIQSGNIVFKDAAENIDVLEKKITTVIKEQFGYNVPVLILKQQLLLEILGDNPFEARRKNNEIDTKKLYFMLLYDSPDALGIQEISSISCDPEEFVITQNVVYLYAVNGYGKTKLNANFFEKKLKCTITARNHKTLSKLLELSE